MDRHGEEMWRRSGREIGASYERRRVPVGRVRATRRRPFPSCTRTGSRTIRSTSSCNGASPSRHDWFTVLKLDATTHFAMLEEAPQLADAIESFVSDDAVTLRVSVVGGGIGGLTGRGRARPEGDRRRGLRAGGGAGAHRGVDRPRPERDTSSRRPRPVGRASNRRAARRARAAAVGGRIDAAPSPARRGRRGVLRRLDPRLLPPRPPRAPARALCRRESFASARGSSGWRRDDGHAELLLADGSRVRCDAVVAADGIRSPVRQQLVGRTIRSSPEPSSTAASRRGTRVHELHPDLVNRYWLGPERHAVAYWIASGDLLAVNAAIRDADWARESWTDEAASDEVLPAFAGWHEPLLERLRRCRRVPPRGRLRPPAARALDLRTRHAPRGCGARHGAVPGPGGCAGDRGRVRPRRVPR